MFIYFLKNAGSLQALRDSPHPSLHDPTVPKRVEFKYNNGIYLCARPRQLSLQGCQVTITNFTKEDGRRSSVAPLPRPPESSFCNGV